MSIDVTIFTFLPALPDTLGDTLPAANICGEVAPKRGPKFGRSAPARRDRAPNPAARYPTRSELAQEIWRQTAKPDFRPAKKFADIEMEMCGKEAVSARTDEFVGGLVVSSQAPALLSVDFLENRL